MSGVIRKKEPGQAWETVEDTGGGGGGSAFTRLRVGFDFQVPVEGQTLADFAAPIDADSGSTVNGVVTSQPQLTASGTVFNGLLVEVRDIPVSATQFNAGAFFIVTNMTGSETIIVQTSSSATGDTTMTLDWSSPTVTQLAGTDLAWVDVTFGVVSTAGGVFVGLLLARTTWGD